MKVINLLQDLLPSGLERMLASSSEEWTKSGVEMVIVAQGPTMLFEPNLHAVGYEILHIRPITKLAGMWDWARTVRNSGADVIHLHSESQVAAAILLSKLANRKIPIVRTVHSVFNASGYWGLKRRIYRFASEWAVSANIAVSHYVQFIEERFHRKCTVISNWVDKKYTDSGLTDSIRCSNDLALVGNCSTIKNHNVVLKAALTEGIAVHHLGDEAAISEEELSLLHELETRGLLQSRGVADPLAILSSGVIFAMPSLLEGLGISLAEAICLGNACIVSSAPSLDWSGDFESVLRADPESAASWSAAYNYITAQAASERTSAGLVSREAARERFSVSAGVRAYIDLYIGIGQI